MLVCFPLETQLKCFTFYQHSILVVNSEVGRMLHMIKRLNTGNSKMSQVELGTGRGPLNSTVLQTLTLWPPAAQQL